MLHNYNQWKEGSEGFELFDWEEIEGEVEEDKEVDVKEPLEALQPRENISIEMNSMKSHQKKDNIVSGKAISLVSISEDDNINEDVQFLEKISKVID